MDTAILGRRNEWWAVGKSSVVSAYKISRDELSSVIQALDERRIQIIMGPRRVGKSTLMQQSIGHLLKSGVDPKRILFFSCDDPTIFSGQTTIGDVIESYLSDILHEAATALTDRVYVFIDEIHMFESWQLWLKNYYEPNYNIKFVVSGSSASHLFDGAKESLLGRTDTLCIMPLNFTQFCRFWAQYRNDDKTAEFLSFIPEGSLYTEPLPYCETLIKNAWRWDNYKPYVNAALKEFLMAGGYPEYFSTENMALWQKRLADDIISQGLYRDIVNIYKIKTPDKLEKLLFFIADNNGQCFNMKTIADTIGCDNETVSSYLKYLSQSYMAIVLNIYAPNAGKILRKNKTLYVSDNGIANALLRLPEITDTQAGRIVESICARDALEACEKHLWALHYWRHKDAEVDIVIDRKTDVIPIEVKYREVAKQNSLPTFRRAFPDKKIPFSVVITKDKLCEVDEVLHVPFWLAR